MTLREIVALLGGVVFAAGCLGGGGTMNARLLDSSATRAMPLEMDFESEIFGSGGTLTTTLPSGENFKGHYSQISSASGSDTLGTAWGGWGVWEPYWGDWGPHGSPWVSGNDFATFVQNYNGKVVATLFGDRGDTMRCRFQLTDREEGIGGGGVGQCQTSNGDTLDAQF